MWMKFTDKKFNKFKKRIIYKEQTQQIHQD